MMDVPQIIYLKNYCKSQSTVVLCIQVNEKFCRLRMATYRDGVKGKETRLGWEYNSHIVCMQSFVVMHSTIA